MTVGRKPATQNKSRDERLLFLEGRGSATRLKAGRLDVAQLPGDEDADEDQYRKPDTKGQCVCHAVGLGLAIATIFHHEEQGGCQAGEDGQKCQCNQVGHEQDYRVTVSSAQRRGAFWLLSGLALVAMAITAALGRWQLDRAAQKEAMQAAIEARTREPVLDGLSLVNLTAPEEVLHRRIEVHGTWLAEHTVYLDNRQMQGRQGFYVITPLQLQGHREVVLVQRGWVPRDFADRTRIPALVTPAGAVVVGGRIALPPSQLYAMGSAESGPIRQNLDLAQFRQETGLPLVAVSLLQTHGEPDGLLRDWPAIHSGVDKHYGYAFQWFGLCALIALLYVWFQIVKPRVERRRD